MKPTPELRFVMRYLHFSGRVPQQMRILQQKWQRELTAVERMDQKVEFVSDDLGAPSIRICPVCAGKNEQAAPPQ